MRVYNGNKLDKTDISPNAFLQINSCGFQNPPKGYTVIRKNGRRDYHLVFLNSGECEVLHRNTTYTLTAGSIFIYAPSEEQKYSFRTDSTTMWCHFTGTAIEEILTVHNVLSGVYSTAHDNNISEAYLNLIRRFNYKDTRPLANASFLELLFHISCRIANSETAELPDTLSESVKYMHIHYNNEITLDLLAQKSGYSKSRFSHIFKEKTGSSPIKYLNEIRLKISIEMLTSTTLSIGEIAESCGFCDQFYYSRIFKAKYGLSPSSYREKHR